MRPLLRAIPGLVLVLCFTACSDDTVEFGSVVELRADEQVVMADNTVVSLTAINDSRCPTSVDCIWEGRAEVVLLITRESGEQEVALNDVEKASVIVDNYLIEFIELNPYPESVSLTPDSVLKLKISLN
ncbi:MAG: hypothetical protein HEP71_02145 [Roseivirga sp.]|nr:hypothetical protein [Roseivirga sp.]